MSRLPNLPPRSRGGATKGVNAYERLIARWQQEYDAFGGIVGYEHIQLIDYLGFTDGELRRFTSTADLRDAIRIRRQEVERRVREQKRRARTEGPITKQWHGLGRNHEYLADGVYVYMAVAFHHGAGGFFMGYIDTDPEYGLTFVNDWM